MGRIFNLLVRVLILAGFKDTQCGFKLLTREAALEIIKRQKIERFSFDVEMLYIAEKHGYKIKEVGITWRHDLESKSKILNSFNILLSLLKRKYLEHY